MKFTLSWLTDHLATKAGLDDILALMLKAGLEVEEVVDPNEKLAPFTVCKVIEAVPHPDADKLRVCTVETVDGTKQIVCGAPNARTGMTAIYAPLGAYIPGLDFALDKKPRAIRGIESQGMMCSAKELEAGEDHDGIADLDDSIPLGTPAAQALGATDPVIDFEVTPNRPDWLGVQGIARDLAAAGAGRLIVKEPKRVPGSFDCPVDIRLDAPQACPIFAGAVIRGVTNGPSPDWMQARLKAVGVQPKSLLVDVTNYISFDRARPLHVYDAAKLSGPVVARLGKKGESLEALDGKTYKVTPEMCVIADDSGVIGLGGVMGGTSTAVSDDTTDVFIESAWFDPLRTARTGRTTGIHSDARYRFERGVDPQSCVDGLNLALELTLEHGGGTVSKPNVAGAIPARIDKVTFYPADVERLTGLVVKPTEMRRIVKDLGFSIEDAGDAWYVLPPSHRFDMEQSADLVEEIARLIGYDMLPVTSLPEPDGGRRAITTPIQDRVRVSRRVLAARGFLEAVSWSFMAKEHAALFAKIDPALTVSNPVASELDQMRPSILGNLAMAAQRAANHGEPGARLFEVGPIYLGDGPKDQRTAAAALVRPDVQRHWQGTPHSYDSFAAKADMFAVLDALGQPGERFQVAPPAQPHWHPGKAASLKLGPKVTVGHFGAIHPGVLKAMGIDGPMFGFELNLNALPLMKTRPTKTKPVLKRTELTPIRRDLAFLVDVAVPAADLVRNAIGADKQLIVSADVFDVYQGTGVPDGQKSVAFEVTIQPREKLTDEDIQALMARVVASVAKGTGGVLRG
ncbi:phenylalanine--tRNA ligase subunit beta [Hyphomonas johnsonii]|uniref:Phenylalanine--tRNA ligase beta subunit n=1 Tax=Hyphomonas johnsonii MHS-2 TaxID=1280950 RepID=A0A059FQ92_9PROT|nr:phenylalanine--tRNA ligase subunit beta [Hyphomonas johnsonii]KCZ92787.1 phenylalanyl-tRNA ligase subunit beta [Hyphomonas johnsonii MHS-2]